MRRYQRASELHTDPVNRARIAARERKHYARRAVHEAVAKGRLVKPDRCTRCLAPKEKAQLQGHHADYDKPLEVEWICQQCHNAEHGRGTRSDASVESYR